ncbi:MAG: TetR/AcrR family transcriptional regulator, partial [Chloroflexi bacterium]|nr:TetR/AcrR family transcriptional regulator [Chloroflexota bacterium]
TQILDSAQELFIQKGFAGTSMSDIARHSGVTQSMIHHYFGSKQGLWDDVKKMSYDAYLSSQQQLLDSDDGDITTFIQQSIESRFHYFQQNPQVAKLLSWLQINEDPFGMETGQEIGQQMLTKIKQAQADGIVRQDITPESILAISIALTTHWFQQKQVIHNFAGHTEATQETADSDYLDAILKLFMDGLHINK